MTTTALVALLCAAPVQWLGPKPSPQVKRVVTLAPSLTETVLALGAGETLVGVSRFDEASEVSALPRVGGFNDPAVESIVALKPQLVVVQKAPGNQRAVETLARLGVTVLALPLTTIDDVTQAMRELGRVLARTSQAEALVSELSRTREKVRAAAKTRGTRPRVMFVYGFEPLIVAGPGAFAHELLEDCGAANVAEQAPTAYPMYSVERALALTPDVVIDAADTATGKKDLQALAPMKKARWVTLPSRDLLHPGPALARALPGLCALFD